MTVLDIQNLQVRYGARVAVKDVSLEVTSGEIFGLLGPNGAGKTSTLSVIEGLQRPAAGRVLVCGEDTAQHPQEAKARLGVQLQSNSFQPELTLKELVQLYGSLYGVPLTGAQAKGKLEHFGLAEEASHRASQLSGGQQQRLALTIALVHDPELALLDEPTTGLDPQSRRHLWKRIETLRTEKRSVLLTTHSMEEASALCDRIAIMDHGEILAQGTPKGLIERYGDKPEVVAVSRGPVTLEDVFIGLTGQEVRA